MEEYLKEAEEHLKEFADNIFNIVSQAEKKYDTFVTKYIKDNKLSINKKEALEDSDFIDSFAGFLFAVTCLDYADNKIFTLKEEGKEELKIIFKEKYNISLADFINNYQKKISKIVPMDSYLFEKLEEEKTFYVKNDNNSGLMGYYVTDYEHIITVIKEDKQKREEYLDLLLKRL